MRRVALLAAFCAACASAPKADEAAAGPAVVLEGVENVDGRELLAAARRELESFGKFGRRPADAADAAYSMEVQLREEGFPDGRVEFRLEAERLVFIVREGPRTYLGNVTFEGRESVPEETLQALFDFAGSGIFATGRPYFRLHQVDGATREVERAYLLAGFYRVRIEPPRVEWSDDRTRADVTIVIHEGRQHKVANVVLTGIEPIDLGIEGEPYHVRLPVEAAARIRRRLLDRGFQNAEVDTSVDIERLTGKVTITIDVQPGEPVRLREVSIDGNDRTNGRFLRRRIPLEKGDLLLQSALDEAVDNLYRSGLFSAVLANLRPVGGAEDEADLIVDLKELRARSVDFEVGYGSYELARGAVRYSNRNLLGIGRRLSTEVRGSVRSVGGSIGIEDPWILGPSNTLSVGGGVLQREEPSFDLEEITGDVTVRHVFSRIVTLTFGYEFRASEARNVTGPIADSEAAGFQRAAGLFTRVRFDTRDHPFLPGEGGLVELGVLYSAPFLGANLDFIEGRVLVARYRRIAPRLLVAVGARITSRFILDGRGSLPIQERLFLGGESSVRSFSESRLGPFDAERDPVGGLTSMEGFLELRLDVWQELQMALFYDLGMVSPQSLSIDGPPGHGVGVGLRYLFPVGPIRLDLGYNPGRLFANSGRWELHFAFGFSF